MKQENAYKIKLVKILEILRQDSDEDNYIETSEILSKLAAMGIVCDRRTLATDIEVLNSYGYEVLSEKSPGKPNRYCVIDRSFDVPELRILMDAVQASRFITPKKTEVLIDKIANLGGSHRSELLKSNVVKFNTTKGTNENIFYSINEINTAIEKGYKVSFEYFDFDINHNRVYRREGKRYFVNPLATIFDDDNYYLICYYAKHEDVVHYRIDRMDHVEMVCDQPKEPFKGDSFDLKHHKRTLFGMFQGNEVQVEFRVHKTLLDTVFDVFGDTIELNDEGNDYVGFRAAVQQSTVFYGWCLSFGDKIQVIGPNEVVEKLAVYLREMAQRYNSTREIKK